MARDRQLVLMKPPPSQGRAVSAELAPMGSLREVQDAFAPFNTAVDGSPARSPGLTILHGPGIVVEIPLTGNEVRQALVTIKDEDLAWSVLWRLCRKNGWRMMDPETGQTFG